MRDGAAQERRRWQRGSGNQRAMLLCCCQRIACCQGMGASTGVPHAAQRTCSSSIHERAASAAGSSGGGATGRCAIPRAMSAGLCDQKGEWFAAEASRSEQGQARELSAGESAPAERYGALAQVESQAVIYQLISQAAEPGSLPRPPTAARRPSCFRRALQSVWEMRRRKEERLITARTAQSMALPVAARRRQRTGRAS